MAISLVVISACGGSGGSLAGGGGSGSTLAAITVALPPGVAPGEATVSTLRGESSVSAGQQTLSVSDSTPTMVVVTETASGKLLSLAFLKPTTSPQAVDAEAAAAALLFVALGGSTEQAESRASLFDQVVAATATKTLGTVIAGQWATNRYALDTPDAALKTALSDALSQIMPTIHRPQQTKPEATGDSREFTTKLQISLNHVKGDNRYWLQYESGTLEGSYLIQNASTRPASAFQYTMMHDETPVDPVSPFGSLKKIPYLHQPSTGDYFGNASTLPIVPELQGNDMETRYWHVVLSPVFGQPDPSDFGEPYWASELPKWRAELELLRQKAIVRIFEEVILDFVGAGGLVLDVDPLEQTIPLLDAAGSAVHLQMENAKREDALLSTLSQLLLVAGAGDDVAKNVLAALKPVAGTNAGFLDPANLSPARVAAFRAALRLYATIGIIEPLAEYGPKLRDLQSGSKMTLLEVRVSRGDLELKPNIGEYGPGETIPVKASVRNYDAADDVTFRWTQEVSGAVMTAGDGQTGFVIDTPSDSITLRTNSGTRGTMKVKCELFVKNDQGARVKVAEEHGEYKQIGDLPYGSQTWSLGNGTIMFLVYTVVDKKVIGRNRYQGGTYRVERYSGETLLARYNFHLPEFVGLQSNIFGTYPADNDRKVVDPGRYLAGEGVDAYDHGDKLFLVLAKGLWTENSTQQEIDQTRATVLNSMAGTTLFAWRISD